MSTKRQTPKTAPRALEGWMAANNFDPLLQSKLKEENISLKLLGAFQHIDLRFVRVYPLSCPPPSLLSTKNSKRKKIAKRTRDGSQINTFPTSAFNIISSKHP